MAFHVSAGKESVWCHVNLWYLYIMVITYYDPYRFHTVDIVEFFKNSQITQVFISNIKFKKIKIYREIKLLLISPLAPLFYATKNIRDNVWRKSRLPRVAKSV